MGPSCYRQPALGNLRQTVGLALLGVGCASTPVAKTPWAEAFGTPLPSVEQPVVVKDSRSSPELQAALMVFSAQSEITRAGAVRGQSMAAPATQSWLTVLAEVGRVLTRPNERLSPFDLARARLVVQSQLAADAELYGDFPVVVAEGAQRSLLELKSRLAQLAPARRVDVRNFRWPLAPVVVTSPFGDRLHPITGDYRFHNGLDLLAELAQPIRAAYDGVVVYSGWNGSYGKQIELQHDGHLSTRYGHLLSLLVGDGAQVKRGQVIGLAGSTGRSTGVHLHFEVLRDGQPENPEADLPDPAEPSPAKVAQNGTSPGFPQSSLENPRF